MHQSIPYVTVLATFPSLFGISFLTCFSVSLITCDSMSSYLRPLYCISVPSPPLVIISFPRSLPRPLPPASAPSLFPPSLPQPVPPSRPHLYIRRSQFSNLISPHHHRTDRQRYTDVPFSGRAVIPTVENQCLPTKIRYALIPKCNSLAASVDISR